MSVYGIGFFGNDLCVYRGIIGIAFIKIERDGSIVGITQTYIAIDNGYSGGAVYNYDEELIGIMSFRMVDSLGNVTFSNSYAISLKEIIEFLKKCYDILLLFDCKYN